MKNLPLLLILTIFWSACQLKSDPAPNVQDPPYFTVTYNTDSLQNHEVVAGLDNVYLFTDYSVGADDVATCFGTFSDVQCQSNNCAGQLRFEFRNNQLGSVVLADSLFRLGTYTFSSEHPPVGSIVYRNFFQVNAAANYSAFNWQFGNGASSTDATVTLDFPEGAGPISVQLKAKSNSGPLSEVNRLISPTLSGVAFPNVDIRITSQNSIYNLEALHTGPMVGIDWSNGSSQFAFMVDSLEPVYKAVVQDTLGHEAYAQFSGLPKNIVGSLRTLNFTKSITEIYAPSDSLQFGRVAIQWTDSQGKVWRSDRGTQPVSKFQVIETAPYDLNEKGDYTRQMIVSFSCLLYDDNGASRPFSGEGRIGVAYPN